MVKFFEETESAKDILRPVHDRFARFTRSIAAVSEAEDSNVSISQQYQKLGLVYLTILPILHLDLQLPSCKLQLTKQLKPDHLQCRTRFFEQNFLQGRGTFHTRAYVNKRICRIWVLQNPRVIEERPVYHAVWCALWSSGVV